MKGRNVTIGPSLLREMTREAESRGTSRSREVVRYASIGLSLDHRPPVRVDAYIYERTHACDGGAMTLFAPEDFLALLQARAQETGETVSEALRAALYAGLLSRHLYRPRDPAKRALAVLQANGPMRVKDFAGEMWRNAARIRGNGLGRAGPLLRRLVEEGLAVEEGEPPTFRLA